MAEIAHAARVAPLCAATASLRYRPESARTARRLVREKLQEWGLDDLVDPAELIVSELVSNALKTGCVTFMEVGIQRPAERCVRVFVWDGSRELPTLIEAGEEEECHRGLALVHALTSGRWGTTLDARGKTVHADLPVP